VHPTTFVVTVAEAYNHRVSQWQHDCLGCSALVVAGGNGRAGAGKALNQTFGPRDVVVDQVRTTS